MPKVTFLQSPRLRIIRGWALEVFILAVVLALELPRAFRFVHGEPISAATRATETIGICLVSLPLLARRRRPLSVFAVVVVFVVGFTLWDAYPIGDSALAVALYTVASLHPRRSALVAAVVAEATALVAVSRLPADDGGGLLVNVLLLTGMVVAATALGLYVSTRRAYVRELLDRAERLERERAQSDALAAATERARIAREMHDIVAHNITVMVALSDAAMRLVRRDPERALETLSTVSATGREALQDTRSLLGVLGSSAADDDTGSRRPMPKLTDLDALVEQVREAGLTVAVEMHGEPAPLRADAQLAVYRMIQESLTNTMKHAPKRSQARVELTFAENEVRLVVDDDGAGQLATPDWRAGGGTTGMQARVSSLGGQLESGPRPAGGWRVQAVLPLPAPLRTSVPTSVSIAEVRQ